MSAHPKDETKVIDHCTDLNFGIQLVNYYTPTAFYNPMALIALQDAKEYHLPKEYMSPVIKAHLERMRC